MGMERSGIVKKSLGQTEKKTVSNPKWKETAAVL
jgi:hypothetical protein